MEGEPKAHLKLQTEESPEVPGTSTCLSVQQVVSSSQVRKEPGLPPRVHTGQCRGGCQAEVAHCLALRASPLV